jgi:hypothetical protein
MQLKMRNYSICENGFTFVRRRSHEMHISGCDEVRHVKVKARVYVLLHHVH